MTPGDAARILAACATFDNRKVRGEDGEQMAVGWFAVIGDLEYLDALEAVRRHYRDSTEWMMPAHIRRGVAALKAERRRAQPDQSRAIASRFEQDESKAERTRRGLEVTRAGLAEAFERMALRHGSPEAMSGLEALRAATQGPVWADPDENEEDAPQ